MTYIKHTWVTGEIITAEKLNNIEDAIEELYDLIGGNTKYAITYTLAANIVSSNTARKVADGNAYSTTISSSDVDYQVGTITVMMGSTDITASVVSGTTISIPAVTADVTITATAVYYPEVVTDASTLTISSGGTGTLRVKLAGEPTQNQTVTLASETLTLSSASLTFTSSNYDTYQSVAVTAPSTEMATYEYISIKNSDPMMTESTVMVSVTVPTYDELVDTTIPTVGMHTITVDDFDTVTVQSNTYLQLVGYNAQYSNIRIPASIAYNENNYTPIVRTTSFQNNTTLEYVTVESGVMFSQYGAVDTKASSSFNGCTNLIGVELLGTNLTQMPNTFKGCTKLKFVKGLENQTDLTSMSNTFNGCTAFEYLQDISSLTKVTTMGGTFDSSGIKKLFGVPSAYDSNCSYASTFNNCASLIYAEVPSNAVLSAYAFAKTRSCKVYIHNDNLTTTDISSQTFYQATGVTVYCTDGSTTEESLESAYGSSLNVTIKNFGNAQTPLIVVWGDSISSPNQLCIEWPKRLQTQLGTSDFRIKNVALSGECSSSTTARQGGYVMTTGTFTIPATTDAVEITITVNGTETFSGGGADVSPNAMIFTAGAGFNPCTISGVVGSISRSGEHYYFTRESAGTAVSVSAGTVITSNNDTEFNNANNVMLFYLNGNAGWHNDGDVLLDMCQKAVNHFTALGGTKYIVAGPAANKLLKTTAFRNGVEEFETKAATAFGTHWLNLREYEITYGLTQNNLTASALDTQRMAQGLVPASLVGGGDTVNIQMYDGVTNTDENHPNVYGANTIMLAFYEKGQALGYWS